MNLVVYDDKVKKAGEELKKLYADLDSVIMDYKYIIRNLLDNGIKSGKIHDSLNEFLNQVTMCSSVNGTCAEDQGESYKTYCDNFINMLDEADKDLY